MTRQEAVQFLVKHPAKFAHMLGFTKLDELHNEWIRDMVLGTEDATLQAHRGSYKTTCVSVALCIIIILFPNEKTLFMRKTDEGVKEIVRQVKKMLEDPHTQYFVKCIYGVSLKLDTQNVTEITTNLTTDPRGTSQLVAKGCGSALTNKHFERIFTDDIVNVDDRTSKAEREKTKRTYQELQNIRNKGGRIYNTGTPWHKDDCFTIMPTPKKYDCYETGILTEAEIADRKAKMTPSLFAVNYELKHIPSEDILFSDPQTGADTALAEQGWTHVDAAFYGEDYTAFTALNIHGGKFYVFGKCWRKHVDEKLDEICGLHSSFMARKMFMELNADKGYVAKQARRRGVKVSTYHESQNKYIKISSHLKSEWPDVIFVEGTDPKYIEQICDYNEDAEHDDCPDSLASLIRIMSRRKNETTDGLFMY